MPPPPSKSKTKIEWKVLKDDGHMHGANNNNKNNNGGSDEKSADLQSRLEKQSHDNRLLYGKFNESDKLKDKKFEYAGADAPVGIGVAISLPSAAVGGVFGFLTGGFGFALGAAVGTLIGLGVNADQDSRTAKKEKECKELKEKCEIAEKEYLESESIKEVANALKKLENELKQLAENEKNIINNFSDFKYNCNHKRIMLIGPTRWGKSALANRLLGYGGTLRALSKASENEVDFEVGKTGNVASQTDKLALKTKLVTMKNCNEYVLNEFILTVIDTPGAFDTNGKTEKYHNEMLAFGRKFGGINMFIIVFKFGAAFDENYQKLLKNYEKFWGKNFWTQCVIMITHCDRDSEDASMDVDDGIDKTKNGIRKFLKYNCNIDEKFVNAMPMFEIGKQNYRDTLVLLFEALNDNNIFSQDYKCKDIRFPIDDTWDQVCQTINKAKNSKEYTKMIDLRSQYIRDYH